MCRIRLDDVGRTGDEYAKMCMGNALGKTPAMSRSYSITILQLHLPCQYSDANLRATWLYVSTATSQYKIMPLIIKSTCRHARLVRNISGGLLPFIKSTKIPLRFAGGMDLYVVGVMRLDFGLERKDGVNRTRTWEGCVFGTDRCKFMLCLYHHGCKILASAKPMLFQTVSQTT